eukprot:10577495-Heterocapsa_arctica.AAC.1
MENAYCANAQTQVYNISGGNEWHATLCQTWGGCSSKRSEHKLMQSHSASGPQGSSQKSGPETDYMKQQD